ncbi:heavy metal translocating P-type ATPase metal-binding domain-containing protein [Undibacterium umbellatum]|uniref:Heavy metal translocating P-type ATPase metal-binding domain-containing protein n=1 Tax=Undibacterium umbellatum TaxID=2762300 RepID=A0ABR6Z3Q4_9BURK|nr:heavy metal translocating P-type ATPase metal-binding domain-containing protein [Undibacterium umbellatum]MBC3906412.1 heavy metal translocating P-type ATPase metal-binding domain-containing protein [Undibacterium umbellatum]
MAFAFSSFLDSVLFSFKTGEKIDCFHCGEKMRKSNALTVQFNGYTQPVCCHGCLAILSTVEQNNLVNEYMKNKASQPVIG